MKYFVIEMQTGESGAALINAFDTRSEAEYKYHDIMKAASISNVPKHGAMIITDTMDVIDSELAYREDYAATNLFYVFEFQSGETASALYEVKDTMSLALQKYHTVLSYADVSEVSTHGAMIVAPDLFVVRSEVAYREAPEPEPEEEPEE